MTANEPTSTGGRINFNFEEAACPVPEEVGWELVGNEATDVRDEVDVDVAI